MGLYKLTAAAAVVMLSFVCAAQAPLDSDHDGLSDELEQRLLAQFTPKLMIGQQECSVAPAEFAAGIAVPKALADNGTIYGQAFPLTGAEPTVELHYYHLWRTDCGPHGHALDAEHVSVMVRGTGESAESAKHWRAAYWFAAAHEDTVCDVSQITRASTLKAEEHGAMVWISPGKHASYLNATLCKAGCGADRCESMKAEPVLAVVNLGELKMPMNGAMWSSSKEWPLAAKMSVSDFPAEPVARLETLPDTDIAWFHPGKHPAQGVIAISGKTAGAIGGAGNNTANALGTSGDNTATAISLARDKTGNALSRSFHATTHALGTSAGHVGKAIGVKPSSPQEKTE